MYPSTRAAFDDLFRRAVELGESFPIMPIDEIRLGVAFAELPDKEYVVKRLVEELFDHPDLHVRRIAIQACRRAEAFDVAGLEEALARKLEDPAGWVRYDAAWTIHDAGYDSPRIRQRLGEIAGDAPLAELKERVSNDRGDSGLAAQARARETLDTLVARDDHQPLE